LRAPGIRVCVDHDQVNAMHNERRRWHKTGQHDQSPVGE
jgi:hypothetical protein